jgi:hypothetical protein
MNGAFWSAGECTPAATVVAHRGAVIPVEAMP